MVRKSDFRAVADDYSKRERAEIARFIERYGRDYSNIHDLISDALD